MDERITLEYIGPPNQEWFDPAAQKQVTLVAGRRYPIPADIAEEWLKADTHWKRPEPARASGAAVKE